MLASGTLAFAVLVALPTKAGLTGPFDGPLVGSEALEPAPWAAALSAEASRWDDEFEGRFAAYVSDPYRCFRWGYNDEVPYYLASGVKITFMLEVFRQRAAGRLSFDETLPYTAEDVRDGAPRLNRQRFGKKFSISTLLDWMMRSSDNAASDMLAERVGLPQVERGLVDEGIIGFSRISYLIDVRRGIYRELDVTADDLTPYEVRKIRWTKIWTPQVRRIEQLLGKPRGTFDRAQLFAAYDRYYETGVNHAPMRSVGRFFEKMATGTLVDAESSREMVALMSGARTSTHRLLGRLPRGTPVAHKTGSQFRKVCDMGIITLPDGKPLIVSVCTSGGRVAAAEATIARVARAAYDHAVADHHKAAATAREARR